LSSSTVPISTQVVEGAEIVWFEYVKSFEDKSMCEPLITAEQAAEILNCSPKTVKRMAVRGEIPAMQIGNRWRFRRSALDEYIRHQLLCLSKTSKCLSGWQLYFLSNSPAMLIFLRTLLGTLPSMFRFARRLSWRTCLCATRWLCYSAPRENA
jgi:excisionase family DNA binding protein